MLQLFPPYNDIISGSVTDNSNKLPFLIGVYVDKSEPSIITLRQLQKKARPFSFTVHVPEVFYDHVAMLYSS